MGFRLVLALVATVSIVILNINTNVRSASIPRASLRAALIVREITNDRPIEEKQGLQQARRRPLEGELGGCHVMFWNINLAAAEPRMGDVLRSSLACVVGLSEVSWAPTEFAHHAANWGYPHTSRPIALTASISV